MIKRRLLGLAGSVATAAMLFASPSHAAVNAFFSLGATCGGAASTSYTAGGPTLQVSLCAAPTAGEALCGHTAFLQSAVGESGQFNITARALGPGFPTTLVATTFPYPINNPNTAPDFGSFNTTFQTGTPQLLATFTLAPQGTATNASYVISTFNSSVEVDTDGTCGASTTTPISASFTLNRAFAPSSFSAAAPPAGTVGSAYNYSFVANGAPTPTYSVSAGAVPAGLTLSTAGVLSGTPTTIGTSNFTVTATNASGSTSTGSLSVTISGTPQTITFANPGTQTFSTTPFNSLATASSGLPVTLTSTTLGVCTTGAPAVGPNGPTITMVTAGTCTVTATQAGGSGFAAAPAVGPLSFTINPSAPAAPTGVTGTGGFQTATIAFTAPTNTGGVPLAATPYSVTCTGVAPATTTVTGTVSPIVVPGLTNGNTYACTLTVSNNAALSTSAAPVNVTPVNIAPPAFTSGAAVPTLTVGVAMATFNITTTGGPTPTITQAGVLPTGVVFASTVGTGVGTLTGTPSTAGTFNITLTATNSQGTVNQPITITVNKANQTITFVGPAAQTFSATPVTVSATASSALAVVFTSTTPTICSVTGTSVTMITVGTCTIAANQAGNANFNAAPQVTQSFAINQATQTITFGAQAARPFSATPSSLSPLATASSGLAVSYTSTTPAVCSITGASVTTITLGTCTIQANQAGNTNFSAAAPVSQSFNITQGTQVINFSNPPDTAVNAAPFNITPFAVATSGLVVTFASTTPSVCTTSGANGATVTVLVLGACSITATQAGNANFSAAAPVSRTFQVIPPGAVTLATSASPARYRQSVTLTATVIGTNPTGTVTFSVMNSAGTTILCNAIPLASGTATCVVPGTLMTTPLLFFVASYSGDANNNANTFTLQQGVNMSAITLTAFANPLSMVAGRPITLKAMVTAQTISGNLSFNENGAALPGCGSVTISLLPGATDIGVATCTVAAPSAGTHNYVVTYPHTTDSGFEQTILSPVVAASGPQDYTDMWWVGASENGWGVSITQHGLIQFIVLYVYDDNGKPIWYVLPNGTWNASQTAYTGQLYQPTSAPFSSYNTLQFNPFGANGGPVGTATVTYNSANTATLSYTINGKSGTKSIQRQVFGADDGQPKLQVNDLWWAGPSENGWGMNIAQQGRVLFPVWYTYDSTGTTRFFAVPGGTWVGNTFTGDIYSTSSSAWLGANYIAANFIATKVGTMSLTFQDQGNALMNYTVNGVTQSKSIVRQPF